MTYVYRYIYIYTLFKKKKKTPTEIGDAFFGPTPICSKLNEFWDIVDILDNFHIL